MSKLIFQCARSTYLALLLLLALATSLAGAPALADEAETAEPLMWSLAPIVRPQVPQVNRTDWPSNDIDRFILADLEQNGFEPAPPVDKAKLIRRVYFDLWGLPPEPQAVRDFVADQSADAYPRLVDRLLDNVHYGERWARYWLDLVRYADTNGYERDAEKPFAWKYRDWIVRAIQNDKPYDSFVLEQLAGDELPDGDAESIVGTGFLRIGTFDDEPNDPLQYKYEQLDDLIHATATAFLATTLKCARCHDHKFDPIPQHDYYAIAHCFAAGKSADAPEVLAFTDASRDAAALHLLKGGDPRSEGDLVEAGFLSMIPQLTGKVGPPAPEAKTTQERLQLARWIVEPKNPLTPRVMVNRLWQHHFGRALVTSSDNFGNTGVEPSHPELLDWLADDLVQGGWHAKRLHRLILLSSTYRMDSVHPKQDEYAGRDAENQHLWRANRQRLDAEALRDAMLLATGELNEVPGGPAFKATISADALEGLSQKGGAWKPSPEEEQKRRSIYMFHKRSLVLPLFTTFDFADTTQPCAQRSSTTVAPQALALLNNQFVADRSAAFARRAIHDAGADTRNQIERIWWLALGRAPRESEIEAAQKHLAAQTDAFKQSNPATGAESSTVDQEAATRALTSLCQVVLNLNEFCYVD